MKGNLKDQDQKEWGSNETNPEKARISKSANNTGVKTTKD